MQVGGKAASAARGSFGIPPHMNPEAVAKAKEEAPPPQVDTSFEVEDDEAPPSDLTESAQRAVNQLKTELDVEMTGDDWSGLFYKGFVEKTILVGQIPDPSSRGLKPFNITVRTLTAEEADEADELFAKEVRDVEMTREGVQNRKQMWVFAYAVQKINGAALCKPVMKEVGKKPVIDRKETAAAKRAVLSQMAPLVLKQASLKYSRFVGLLDELVAEPSQAFFEGP